MHVYKTVILLQKESKVILVFSVLMVGLYAVLNKYRYHYGQAKRKGPLTENDLKLLLKFAKVTKKYYDDGLSLSAICFYLYAKHFVQKTDLMDQVKAPKRLVWKKKMKILLKVVLQIEIKQCMMAKWHVFLLLYHLIKGFAIVSVRRNFKWQTMSECIRYVSKRIPLHQIIRLLTVI